MKIITIRCADTDAKAISELLWESNIDFSVKSDGLPTPLKLPPQAVLPIPSPIMDHREIVAPKGYLPNGAPRKIQRADATGRSTGEVIMDYLMAHPDKDVPAEDIKSELRRCGFSSSGMSVVSRLIGEGRIERVGQYRLRLGAGEMAGRSPVPNVGELA